MKYFFGDLGVIEVIQCKTKKKDTQTDKYIAVPLNSYNCWIFSKLINIDVKDEEEVRQKIADYIIKEQIKLQNKVNAIEELALRIREGGLEKASEYYQNIKNNKSSKNS